MVVLLIPTATGRLVQAPFLLFLDEADDELVILIELQILRHVRERQDDVTVCTCTEPAIRIMTQCTRTFTKSSGLSHRIEMFLLSNRLLKSNWIEGNRIEWLLRFSILFDLICAEAQTRRTLNCYSKKWRSWQNEITNDIVGHFCHPGEQSF